MFAVIFYRQPGSPTWNVLPTVYAGEEAEDNALADATMQASRLGAITMVMQCSGAVPGRWGAGKLGSNPPNVRRRIDADLDDEAVSTPAIGAGILPFPAGAKR